MNLLRYIPGVTELLIRSHEFNSYSVNHSSLTNLRRLDIDNYELGRSKNFIKHLQQLPFLTRLDFYESKVSRFEFSHYGRHLNFPTLLFSNIKADEKIVKQFVL